MGVSIRELARRFEKALEEKLKPTGYDSDGTVTRIEDGKIWVHIPGGVPETPVDITMAAEVGDAVKVRLSGGKAWLTGNKSEPPTGDKIAKEAQHLAMSSNKRVAKIEAEIANGDIGGGTVIWTTTADPVLPDYTFTITDLQGEGTPKVDDIIFAGAYRYVIRSVGSTTLLAGDRESIRGADGATITGVTEMYALSATTTAPADEDFSPNVQTPTEQLPYLWNMEIISYSTGTSTPQAKHILLTYTAGVEGRGISAVTEYYCRSTSLTAPADADFGTSVPTLTETYKYLWNYELITYTDGTRPTTTDKRIIGVYGNRGYGITQLTTHMRSQPLATIMSWVGLVNDTWSGVTSYGGQIGDTVLIACQVTDHDNIVGYMRCVVKGYNSGTQVLTTDNLDFMMGEQGERGPQGPQGPTGPQGPPGKTRVTLQNGDDLNNCITKDYVYVTSSTAVCNSLLNTPYGFPAGELELEVLWLGSDNYIVQKLTCKDGATRKVYLRTYSSGVFGAWTEEGVPYGLCNTTAGTAAKVASISCYDRDSNPYVAIKFTYENTATSPTLNINNIGAAQIMTNGTNSAYWAAGATVNFYYDGTYYQVASTPVYASDVTVGNPNSYNAYIGNAAYQIRNGSSVYTQVDANGMLVQNGASNKKFLQAGTNGLHVYNGSVTEVAVLGYANGTAESGMADAPYFTLGTRSGTIGNWSGCFGTGTASGYMSFIQGKGNTASNNYTMARGYSCTASGLRSFASGYNCTASGTDSIAMGSNCQATSSDSKAFGYYCNSTYSDLFVVGKYNDPTSGDLFEVGDGSSSSRRNAFRVNGSGNAYVRNGLYIGGHASQVGDYKVSEVSTRATVSSGEESKTGCSVSLGIGVWVVGYVVSFVAGSGTRTCALYQGSTYYESSRIRLHVASTGWTVLNGMMIINLTSAATINLYAGHAGVSSSQTYNASLRAVRIA